MKKILFFALVVLLAFTSCQKEGIKDITDDKEPTPTETINNPLVSQMTAKVNLEGTDGIDLDCFTINFTFSLNVDGDIVEISSWDDFEDVLELPQEDSIFIDFVYPFEITNYDGDIETIEDADALGEAFASCIPDCCWGEPGFPVFLIDFESSCYELVYPLSIKNEENNETITVDNQEDLINLMTSGEFYTFVFPFDLTDADGEQVSVTDEDELFQLISSCCTVPGNPTDTTFYGEGFGMIACYNLSFPVNYIDVDGTIQTAADEDDFTTAIFNGDFQNFSYPITISQENEAEIIVNSDGEMEAAILECNFGPEPNNLDLDLLILVTGVTIQNGPIEPAVECYSINYPISVETDGGIFSLHSDNDCYEEMDNDINAQLIYPVTVTLADGQLLALEELADIFNLVSSCE